MKKNNFVVKDRNEDTVYGVIIAPETVTAETLQKIADEAHNYDTEVLINSLPKGCKWVDACGLEEIYF